MVRTDNASRNISSNIDFLSDSIGRVDISNDHDDELFQDPPPKEDCPICMLPMPPYEIFGVGTKYQPCCGKTLCHGCMLSVVEEMNKGTIKEWCPFCRVPTMDTEEEYAQKCMARMKRNDPEAFYWTADCYYGSNGIAPDLNKELELINRAAELGSVLAQFHLARIYYNSQIVEKDLEKAIKHFKLAAIGGHEQARHILGLMEVQQDNMDRAMKHLVIAARSGHDDALKLIGEGYKEGLITKEEYASTLRAYQSIKNEMKSEQRTKALEVCRQLTS